MKSISSDGFKGIEISNNLACYDMDVQFFLP
jgi:hypothetical protein